MMAGLVGGAAFCIWGIIVSGRLCYWTGPTDFVRLRGDLYDFGVFVGTDGV